MSHSEFPKNSINFDKFTGFFDKLLKIKSPDKGTDPGAGEFQVKYATAVVSN